MHYFLFVIFVLFSAIPAYAATVPVSALESGDLIRGQTYSSIYYYGADGLRYVFPNDKTYFTWYKNFDNVKWISDNDLATIQIGGNITYKPGVKMLKINSDPKVYAVAGHGTLRVIESEMVAKKLYGDHWNKQIDDVPDGFFSNYKKGSDIELASQFSVSSEKATAVDINIDKNLKPALVISVKDNTYEPPTASVPFGQAVRWENTGTTNESVTEWDGIWGSGTLKPGQHFTRYFVGDKGTWNYYSIYSPKTTMGGALVVK
jgi:plastocyanin